MKALEASSRPEFINCVEQLFISTASFEESTKVLMDVPYDQTLHLHADSILSRHKPFLLTL